MKGELEMRKSILGQKFGTLTVVEYEGVKNKNSYWLCQCECGQKISLCRCSLKERVGWGCGWDCKLNSCSLKGKKFGKLKIISLNEMKNGTSYWDCVCECGKDLVLKRGHITDGRIRSCGCLRRGKSSRNWNGCGDLSGSFFGKIKSHAKRRKILFDVEIEYLWDLFLQQGGKCALTNEPLKFPTSNLDEKTASLDRINSSKGYIENNVQWVHKDINLMKQQFSQDYFILLCDKVSLYAKGRKNEQETCKKIN